MEERLAFGWTFSQSVVDKFPLGIRRDVFPFRPNRFSRLKIVQNLNLTSTKKKKIDAATINVNNWKLKPCSSTANCIHKESGN